MPLRIVFLLCSCLLVRVASAQLPPWEDQSIITSFYLPPVTVSVSVEPYTPGNYTLRWTNPFAEAGIPAYEQEVELHVFVRDSTGAIGYYTGFSDGEPRTTLSFHTNAREVEVFFLPRLLEMATGEAYHKWVCNFGEYKSVRLSLRDSYPQSLHLHSRKDVIGLQFLTRYDMVENEMPCDGCCEIDKVLVMSRYYLSLKTGKILKGRQWLNRRMVEKLVGELHLRLIDPAARFMDRTGKQHTGAELIAQKKLDLTNFSPDDFQPDRHAVPY